jgi:hypothetical protein
MHINIPHLRHGTLKHSSGLPGKQNHKTVDINGSRNMKADAFIVLANRVVIVDSVGVLVLGHVLY